MYWPVSSVKIIGFFLQEVKLQSNWHCYEILNINLLNESERMRHRCRPEYREKRIVLLRRKSKWVKIDIPRFVYFIKTICSEVTSSRWGHVLRDVYVELKILMNGLVLSLTRSLSVRHWWGDKAEVHLQAFHCSGEEVCRNNRAHVQGNLRRNQRLSMMARQWELAALCERAG